MASDQNPADLLSRGVSPRKLKESRIWWKGPLFLQQEIQFNTPRYPGLTEIPEFKKANICLSAAEAMKPDTTFTQRFSSFTRLRRVLLAYCLRFVANARLKGFQSYLKKTGVLSVQELEDSTLVIIKQIQASEFTDELRCLQAGRQINHKSKLRDLRPRLKESH